MAEHYPTQSVAVLAGQGKVTGWKQPDSNATGAQSGVGDELDQVGNAQVVTTNKPGFNPKEEEAMQLQKGPKKKYIDGNNNNNNNNENENNNDNDYNNNNNFGNDANNDDFFGDNNDNNDNKGVSFASNPTDNMNSNNNNNNNGDGNGMDDFFGGMEDENEDNNTNNDSNLNTGLKSHPTNATVISLPTVGDRDDNDDGDDYEPYDIDTNNNNIQANGYGGGYGDDSKANEETPLSLWEAERRKILQERIDKEKKVQRENQQQAEQDLQEFHDNRHQRINKARNDAKAREDGIRQDYDSVYKNGTIWEQVAKLVDLGSQDESIVRMRDLLIELKNQGKLKQKS